MTTRGQAARSVEGVEPDRANNFDALRLVAALTVLVGHSWPLTGQTEPPEIAGIRIYTLAVYVFFAISGYLITTSWLRAPVVRRFLVNRVLRIFPALILLVVLTIALVGPIATQVSLAEYVSSPTTWRYFQNLSLIAVYDLPGVFENHPVPAVNGVLWTLGPEFICYLLVMVFGLVAARSPVIRASILTVVFAFLSLVPIGEISSAAQAMTFFGMGATLAALSLNRRLPLWPAAVAIPALLVGSWLLPDWQVLLAWIVVPYVVVACGTASTPFVRRVGRFGDFSYGVYLWGFLVQQLVIQVLGFLPLPLNIAVVGAVTLTLAWLSWHAVEKRALAAKARFAGPQRVSDRQSVPAA